MIETRQKILDTAEQLFAANGYEATSLRQVIAAAGVNLAAVHYHFGAKQDLLDAIVLRKANPVNELRIAAIDAVEKQAGDGTLPLEPVISAFLLPVCHAAEQNPQFVRLMGRLHAEGLMFQVIGRHFQPVLARFLRAMRRALPGLPEQEFQWRIHFMIGAMAHTMCGPPDLLDESALNEGFQARVDRLIAFLAAGFRAPVATRQE
jgi:AcrR family transcriptional regulator